jgi:predicted  nucleic acid-binding Zn-ribbon protein
MAMAENDRAELEEKLRRLEAEEREISTLRTKLHDRLSSFDNAVAAEQEKELSAKRRDLHAEIDRIRGLLEI